MPQPRIRAPRTLVTLLLAVAAAVAAVPLSAQPVTTVQGTVMGEDGGPVAGAVVQINQEPGTFARGATTDAAGRYRFAGIPAGRYRVTIRHPGYRAVSGFLLVAQGEQVTQDYLLQVRATQIDTVRVSARNQVTIRREDTEFRTEVREEALQLLPLRTDPAEVVALTPGARADQVWGGSTAQANNYQIDGLAANHPGVGGDMVEPSINWIESIEVRGLGAAAEYGNFQGGLVNINTKRGTNDFQGAFRFSADGDPLTASNLAEYDVAAETRSRFDVEGELRGPLVRDRLFYYVAGQFVAHDEQVVNHLRTRAGFYAPHVIGWTEQKYFGKLSWAPTTRDQLELSGGYLHQAADRFGLTGYEENAFLTLDRPTRFFNGGFTHVFAPGTQFDVSVAGFDQDQRRTPNAGEDVPAVRHFGQNYRPTFNNPIFRYRQAAGSLTGAASVSLDVTTGPVRHALKVGGDYTEGTWIDQRLRNGGMTWRPGVARNNRSFDPANPERWPTGAGFVPTDWGGEVDLNADVVNAAVYVQDHVDLGSRVSLSPGVRYGWWTGYVTPSGDIGPRFRAMHDQAVDGRLGLTVDITGGNDFVLKAHAGRYHQSMFAQFYDRVEGANVYNNQQTWYYYGTPTDAAQTFSEAERDVLAGSGTFRLQEDVRLNQSGPVDPDYRQPYVDQLVLGLEKGLGSMWKAEMVYVGRRNRNMLALVDRNAETNYTRFEKVRVFDGGGTCTIFGCSTGEPLDYNGYQLVLDEVFVPNYMIVDHLRLVADQAGVPGIPGMTPADIPGLTWDPDYVITNVPEAERTFHQVQMVLKTSQRRFGGTLSLVWTQLEGNLDNVAGYELAAGFEDAEDPAGFGAGPFVNPNQAVNFMGDLPNSSLWEVKLWLFGDLGHGFRGGVFWNSALGDRYTPHFRLTEVGYSYTTLEGAAYPARLFSAVAGQPVFVESRGSGQYHNRATLDLHLERGIRWGATEWMLTLDGFNLLGRSTPTRHNTAVNEGKNYTPFLDLGVEPENYYRAVRERVRPRSVRIGTQIVF